MYEKESALQSQKILFAEKESSQLLSRIELLTNENRMLQEKLQSGGEVNKVIEQQLKVKEEDRKKEMESLKHFYETKLEEIKQSDSIILQEKSNQWEKERAFFQEQLAFTQKQIEENQKMHEVLLAAINNRGVQEKEQDSQILQTNKMLSETIAKVEGRNQQLQQKVSDIKIYQRVFKHSQSMQCKFCSVFFPSEIFIDHVKTCNKDNRFNRSHFFQIPMSISIQQTLIKEDPVDNRTYTEYVVQINFNNKSWVVNQKYKSFCALHEKLINQYPNIKFPQSSFQFAQKSITDFGNIKGKANGGGSGSSTMIEDRRKILQQYLQDLALIPAIKESAQMKQFLGVQDHFPEFCDHLTINSTHIITETVSVKQAVGQNFKIMNDIFQNKRVERPKDILTQVKEAFTKDEQPVKRRESQISKPNQYNSKNRYSNISGNNSPMKDDFPNSPTLIEKSSPLSTNNLENLSCIENALLEDGQDFESEYCYQNKAVTEESPLRADMLVNTRNYIQKSHIDCKQSFMTMKNIENSLDHNERQNLYHKNFDQEIQRHESIPIKKSTSSSNLMYSPSSTQRVSHYNTSMMLGDKVNHQKKTTQLNQPSLKENCVACTHKKHKGQDGKDYIDVQQTISQCTPKSSKKLQGSINSQTSQHRCVTETNAPNQKGSGQLVQNNLSLLEELVQKGARKNPANHHSVRNNKHQQEYTKTNSFGARPIQNQHEKQKYETFITPRDNPNIQSSTALGKQTESINNMKSDKILHELLKQEKTTNNQGYFIKKYVTPLKSNCPFTTSTHQKSPFQSSVNKSSLSNNSSNMNQPSASNTPDQLSKKTNFEYTISSQNTLSKSIAATHGSLAMEKRMLNKSSEKKRVSGSKH